MTRSRALLMAIVVIAAAMRIAWNDVAQYSPADETVYTNYTRQLSGNGFIRGYPDVVRAFIDDPRLSRYPHPGRFGFLALTTAAAEMYGAAEPRAIAWLSTIAGILVVPLVFSIGRRWFDERVALLAAAFTAVSPIELALGRRALQDQVVCLVVLIALMIFLTAVQRGRPADIALAVLAMTAAFSVKETVVFVYPAFIAIAIVYKAWRPKHALIFVAPPLLDYLLFSLLARDARAFFRIARIVTSEIAAPYAAQYQAGPPHRLLLDYFITAPFVSLLAAAAVVVILVRSDRGKPERALALFVVLTVAAMGVVSSKNLRYVMMIDPVVRLLAAWMIATKAAIGRTLSAASLGAVAIANGAIELELFHTIFIRGGVYDPVTIGLLEAVGAVPRSNPSADHVMIFPWICAAVFAVAWLYHARSLRPRRT